MLDLTDSQAIIESDALTHGKRRVSEGDYAYIDNARRRILILQTNK